MKKIESDIPVKLICQKLRQLRKSLGFSNPRQFAREMDINYTTYKNYEEIRVPPSEFLFLLKRKYPYEVNLDVLFISEESQIKKDQDIININKSWHPIKNFKYRADFKTNIGDIIKKVILIMESDVIVIKNALIQNIDAFYNAIYWAKGKFPPEEEKKEEKILKKNRAK